MVRQSWASARAQRRISAPYHFRPFGLLPLNFSSAPTAMSLDDPASQSRLSESLRKVQLQQDCQNVIAEEPEANGHDGPLEGSSSQRHLGPAHKLEGYGFRPPSGITTPLYTSKAVGKTGSPLPDANGLGWPGEFKQVLALSRRAHIACRTAKQSLPICA